MHRPVSSLAVAALLAVAMLPRLGNGCLGNSSFARLFQVASEHTWVRVRLQLPPNCQLLLPLPTARLNISTEAGKVLGSFVVRAMRQLPGSKRLDLLQTFSRLEAGCKYRVCLSNHTLLANGTVRFAKPPVCTQVATRGLPGATRMDGILAACLFGLYILCLLLLAAICWRLRTCLGPWRGQVLCNQDAPRKQQASSEPVVATKASLNI